MVLQRHLNPLLDLINLLLVNEVDFINHKEDMVQTTRPQNIFDEFFFIIAKNLRGTQDKDDGLSLLQKVGRDLGTTALFSQARGVN